MIRFLIKWFVIIFLLPAVLSVAWWATKEHPDGWRQASWSSAGLLPQAAKTSNAVIHILSARTGGLKGALAQHSWIVVKKKGASQYDRYEKVGWGSPIRKNAYAADGRWYSNEPQILFTVSGKQAEALIPRVEAAIAAYPHDQRGAYRIWPGPNSNSFVAHVLRQVPEIAFVLPPNAVGRDYLARGQLWHVSKNGDDLKVGIEGLLGISIGRLSGFELNILGLVAGFDVARPALKIPGYGRVELNII